MPCPIRREIGIALGHGDRRTRYGDGHFRMLLSVRLELIKKTDRDQTREQRQRADPYN
jgi:hypothetical protein